MHATPHVPTDGPGDPEDPATPVKVSFDKVNASDGVRQHAAPGARRTRPVAVMPTRLVASPRARVRFCLDVQNCAPMIHSGHIAGRLGAMARTRPIGSSVPVLR